MIITSTAVVLGLIAGLGFALWTLRNSKPESSSNIKRQLVIALLIGLSIFCLNLVAAAIDSNYATNPANAIRQDLTEGAVFGIAGFFVYLFYRGVGLKLLGLSKRVGLGKSDDNKG
jgi:hypothetical protein